MIYGKTNEQRRVAVSLIEHWHVWYAWRPVRLDTGRLCWLQPVMRKGDWACSYDGGSWEWEYKEIA